MTAVAAVAITVASGGAALPVIGSIAASAGISAGLGAISAAINGGDIFDAATDGLVDGFMWGGITSWGGAAYQNATRGNLLNGAKPSIKSSSNNYTSGSPQQVGKMGEKLAGITKNNTKITTPSGRVRIPDGLSNTTLQEVKNVARLSKTKQLTDFMEYAAENNLVMELFIRPTTVMSGPLIKAIQTYGIIIKYLW